MASLNDGELNGARVLLAESAREMRKIVIGSKKIEVGLGWFRRSKNVGDASFVEHLGGGAGFWNCLRVYPEDDCAVVVMGNSTSYDHEKVVGAAKKMVSSLERPRRLA
jgi:CubicO group peptidase (beta-lactamase class C family)